MLQTDGPLDLYANFLPSTFKGLAVILVCIKTGLKGQSFLQLITVII